ncbi:MAG TPA: zinc ribbon domain-containing protein [Anaerolineae bacterium]|nr:zinc ribbon domain-containing protein [Anaerolineae bacterium]
MIRCPKCNTLNRDSSRFCSECGAPLYRTRIRCPQCGTLNPVGNIFCDQCHTRLVPAEETPATPAAKLTEETGPRVQGISLPTRPAPAGESGETGAQQAMPDWLMGFLGPETPEPGETSGAVPDWLVERAEETAPAPEPEPAVELPDWLTGLAEESAPAAAAPAPEPEPAATELPDWLTGLAEESAPAAAAPAPEPEPTAELPDWLAGLVEEAASPSPVAPPLAPEASAEAGIPDWLSGIMEEVPAVEPILEPEPQEPEASLEPAALPDWLAGVMEPEGAPAQKPGAPAIPAAPAPDWLSAWEEDVEEERPVGGREDLGAEDTWPEQQAPASESARTGAGEMAAEVPDWLRALGPRSGAVAVEALPEGLEQAELPMWLEQLRPPGTAPLDSSRAPEAPPGEEAPVEGLTRAEIPDWLQQYRPTATSPVTGTSALEMAVSAPEIEGPLSGLAGLLPALPGVDAPAHFAPAMAVPLPQTVVQEAQLWQQLLEGGAGAQGRPKPRARATSWPAVMVRVMVALVLVLASLLRFSETPLAQPPEQPNISALYTTIEALQPGAEVWIAFDYTLADVDEMDFVVEALLEHLLSREARIVAVSTLPEGPGLIADRFAWALGRPDVSPDSLVSRGFAAGGTAGVAQILTSAAAADAGPDLLVVLTSRPEKFKAWVEQTAVINGARPAEGKPALPLVAGVSAAAAPQLRPYLNASAQAGWLSGFSGVAAYLQARGLPPREDISRRLDALLMTQWLAASLLAAGALFYLLAGKQKTG